MKFHINPETGNPGRCVAQPGNCKYKIEDESHYSTKEEALESYEKLNEANQIKTLKNASRKKESIIEAKESAETSYTYAQWSILNNHIHDSSSIGSDQELFYYSSPAGKLELKRKTLREETPGKYSKMLEKVTNDDVTKLKLTSEESDRIKALLSKGEKILKEQKESERLITGVTYEDRLAIGTTLSEYSNQWMNNLTIDEQETVSHSTYEGFMLTRESKRDINDSPTDEIIKVLKDIKGLNESDYIKYSKDFTNKLKSAVSKAPKLEAPIKIYRGIKEDELLDMFDSSKTSDRYELIQRLLSGSEDNTTLKKENSSGDTSKLSYAPTSATANPEIGLRFAKTYFTDNNRTKILLEIEAKSIASPVNVSAWGVGEAEVLTNHTSDYRFIKARKEKIKNREIIVIKIEEILKNQ